MQDEYISLANKLKEEKASQAMWKRLLEEQMQQLNMVHATINFEKKIMEDIVLLRHEPKLEDSPYESVVRMMLCTCYFEKRRTHTNIHPQDSSVVASMRPEAMAEQLDRTMEELVARADRANARRAAADAICASLMHTLRCVYVCVVYVHTV
jgi:hypothetical protein